MGAPRAVVALASLVTLIVAGGCGSSGPTLSPHDRASFGRIDGLVTIFQRLEGEVASDSIVGSKVRSRAEFVRIETPRIRQISQTSQQLRHEVGFLNDAKAAALYAPLAEAVDRESSDFELFLNAIIQGNPQRVRSVYARLGQDEQRINNVVLEQLPKARAYASTLGG